VRLDLEGDLLVLEGSIVGWETLLTPAEDDEFALVLLANFLQEFPEVLDEAAVAGIVRIILRELSVAAEQINVRLAISADPRFEVVDVRHVEHATRDDL